MRGEASAAEAFALRLAQGPAVLLLGQASLGASPAARLAELNPWEHPGPHALSELVGVAPEPGLRLKPAVAEYPWNGVLTTRVDRMVLDDLRKTDRTVEPITQHARLRRSPHSMQLQFLFGATFLADDQKPPLSRMEALRSEVYTTQALTHLCTEIITPMGVLAVDGWESTDWLDARRLGTALLQAQPGQVHIFGVSQQLREDEIISELVDTGIVVLHDRGLAETMQSLSDTGSLPHAKSGSGVAWRTLPTPTGFLNVPAEVWNSVRRSVRPVDVELLKPPVFKTKEARYQHLRKFMGMTDGDVLWTGIAARTRIEREFEATLRQRIERALASSDLPRPIILSGQTATGKTVALAALAAHYATSGKFLVLYQGDRSRSPDAADIDAFVQWSESEGAPPVLVVWDGMRSPVDYEGLSHYLRTRGHRAVVVGSTYAVRRPPSGWVAAPAKLSPRELDALRSWLGTWLPGGELNLSNTTELDSSFLALLYRALPESERALRQGLAREVREAERAMEAYAVQHSKDVTAPDYRMSAMAAALIKAGVATSDLLPPSYSPSEAAAAFHTRTLTQQLSSMVLTTGRMNVQLPVDLALRVLGREGSSIIQAAIQQHDFFRWVDTDNGDYYLTPRNQLEAELLARDALTLEVQSEVICVLIRNLRVWQGDGGADEVDFIVSLLGRIGPRDRRSLFRPYYGDIAGALWELRESMAYADPRLVIQESAFTRADVRYRQEKGLDGGEARMTDLANNLEVVKKCLLESDVRGRTKLALTVEVADTMGSQLFELVRLTDRPGSIDVSTLLQGVLDAVLEARGIESDNMYPVDVLAWTTLQAVATKLLSPEARHDALASALAAIDSLPTDELTPDQMEMLHKRRRGLNEQLGNTEAVEADLTRLAESQHPASVYLYCRMKADEGEADAALARLRAAPAYVKDDWRCAQLLLRLYWTQLTGAAPLMGEKQPIYLPEHTWEEVLHVTESIRDAPMADHYKIDFIQGMAHFAVGDYASARRCFRLAEEATRSVGRRITTAYVLSDENGDPRVFDGRVQWADQRSGQVWVNDLGTTIWLKPMQFGQAREIVKGTYLPSFCIGFALSPGVLAFPTSLLRRPRQ